MKWMIKITLKENEMYEEYILKKEKLFIQTNLTHKKKCNLI